MTSLVRTDLCRRIILRGTICLYGAFKHTKYKTELISVIILYYHYHLLLVTLKVIYIGLDNSILIT